MIANRLCLRALNRKYSYLRMAAPFAMRPFSTKAETNEINSDDL